MLPLCVYSIYSQLHNKSDPGEIYVIPLFRFLQWLHITLQVKAQIIHVITVAHKASHLLLQPILSLQPYSYPPLFLTLCFRLTGLWSLINTVSLIYFSFTVSSARILPADFWTLIHSFISFRPFYKYYLLPRPSIPTHNSFSIPLSNFIFL